MNLDFNTDHLSVTDSFSAHSDSEDSENIENSSSSSSLKDLSRLSLQPNNVLDTIEKSDSHSQVALDEVTHAVHKALLSDLVHVSTDYKSLLDSKNSSESASTEKHTCEICQSMSKYCCPGCGMRTCSLQCIEKHKFIKNCSGKSNDMRVLPLASFNDEQISRDFHFLTNCSTALYNFRRSLPKDPWHYHFSQLPETLYSLRKAARTRGVVCQFISEGLTRREKNTTRFDKRIKSIIWRCEFFFPESNTTLVNNWGNERFLLKDILVHCGEFKPNLQMHIINLNIVNKTEWESQEYIPEPSGNPKKHMHSKGSDLQETKADQGKEVNLSSEEDRNLDTVSSSLEDSKVSPDNIPRDILKRYLFISDHSDHEALEINRSYYILMRVERLGNQQIYFLMNPHATLHENLRYVFFINEYPTFLVIPSSSIQDYLLIEPQQRIAVRSSFASSDEKKQKLWRTQDKLSKEEAESCARIPCRRFQKGICVFATGASKSESTGQNESITETMPPLFTTQDNTESIIISSNTPDTDSGTVTKKSRRRKTFIPGICPYWHALPHEIPFCRLIEQGKECHLNKSNQCAFRHDLPARSTKSLRKVCKVEKKQCIFPSD